MLLVPETLSDQKAEQIIFLHYFTGALSEGKIDAAKKTLIYFSDVEPQQEMSKGSGALSPNSNIPASFYSESATTDS